MNIVDIFVDFLILILSAVIGFAIFYGANTTGWNATVITLWNLLPLAFIGIGIVALVVKLKYMGKK
jgi:hypothetical protein